MEDYRKLLTALYKKYDPKKISQIDFYLNKYKGKEKQFYLTQKARYTNKKTIKDSEKILSEAIAKIKKEKPKTATKVENSTKENADKPSEKPKTGLSKPVEEKKETVDSTQKTMKTDKPTEPKPKVAAEEKSKAIAASKPDKKSAEDEEDPKDKNIIIVHKNEVKEEEKKKKRRGGWYIWGFILLILAILIVFFFCFMPGNSSDKAVDNTQKTAQQNDNVQIIDSVSSKDTPTVEEPSSKKQSEVSKPADRIYASDINGNVFFVACSAVKKEEQAQAEVSRLKSNDLDVHYYWIPDLVPDGNPFFKVVIGPFDSAKEAMPNLTYVQERVNFDAYLLEIKDANPAQ
jgi:chemotaxis protein histidine kinase CheA